MKPHAVLLATATLLTASTLQALFLAAAAAATQFEKDKVNFVVELGDLSWPSDGSADDCGNASELCWCGLTNIVKVPNGSRFA